MGVVKHLFRFLVMEEIFIGKSLDLGLKPLNFLLQIILHCNRLSFNMFYFSFMRILLLLDNTLQSLSFSQGQAYTISTFFEAFSFLFKLDLILAISFRK
jgi:hypothetical protein